MHGPKAMCYNKVLSRSNFFNDARPFFHLLCMCVSTIGLKPLNFKLCLISKDDIFVVLNDFKYKHPFFFRMKCLLVLMWDPSTRV